MKSPLIAVSWNGYQTFCIKSLSGIRIPNKRDDLILKWKGGHRYSYSLSANDNRWRHNRKILNIALT